ncbi:MAG: hypothetical protein MUE73_20680, partial [Planctomycetes bacterium]|nr:hypothetical protein [Planctomycetota bacterium]
MNALRIGVALSALAFIGPAFAQEDQAPVDLNTYFKLLPEMQQISEKSVESIRTLNRLMKALEQSVKDDEAAGLRAQIRPVLLEHRSLKERMIALVDQILKAPAPARSNLEALRKLHSTTLHDVSWNNIIFKYVVRDLTQALGIPIHLNGRVTIRHQVDVQFPQVTALAALDMICTNFELKWIIYNGEIHIAKKINPNEDRFIEWEKAHGQVDWIGEDEAKTYEDLPVEKAKRLLEKLEGMDLPLLRQRLTKLYVLEGESKRHEVRLAEMKAVEHSMTMFGIE